MEERWLPVSGYEDWYQVSDQGRVRSLYDRKNRKFGKLSPENGRIMHQFLRSKRRNYYYVNLWNGTSARPFSVHRLVLRAFRGEPPPGMQACHNNGISTDNRLENLRWDTGSANNLERFVHSPRTMCKAGLHSWTEDNIIVQGNGTVKRCRACTAAQQERYKPRRRKTS